MCEKLKNCGPQSLIHEKINRIKVHFYSGVSMGTKGVLFSKSTNHKMKLILGMI